MPTKACLDGECVELVLYLVMYSAGIITCSKADMTYLLDIK